jgi:hypothetical protein
MGFENSISQAARQGTRSAMPSKDVGPMTYRALTVASAWFKGSRIP